ncbi:MAG TPA: Hsp20/alpha crystallin family protein [Gammaproteobacteria bacterium]|nr:Hsp20/alpha crystallin family protein [Gammaproteobacteria bacterium]
MATARWEPLRDLIALQNRVNRMFEDVVTNPRRGADQEDMAAGQWTPVVDIFETSENIVIRAEVPGLEQNDLEVEVKDNTLILQGERRFEEGGNRTYHRVERPYGRFQRVFTLPMTVRQDQVQAMLKNGVLDITLVKEEKAKPKRVQVEIR